MMSIQLKDGGAGSAKAPPLVAVREARKAARRAGLHYVTDEAAGITRHRTGSVMTYRGPRGQVIRNPDTLARIRRFAIPPAWTGVWICRDPRGHLQATGRDARGRKQYRYHDDWRATRDEGKFARMIAFGGALPRIRRQVARDLRREGREKVLATVVRLLETTLIRVGNEEYRRTNHSVGLSTMRDRHVSIRGDVLHFDFRGKGGKHHEIDLRDRRLAKIVRSLQELPGQELFQYIDADGRRQKITSTDINAYLHAIGGAEFSAKDFRTWAATVLAAVALNETGKCEAKQARHNLLTAIAQVAQRLGNTPAICRRSYIHPTVMECYLNGQTTVALGARTGARLRRGMYGLSEEERAVLALLKAQAKAPVRFAR